jgi:superfamily II DNA or RNA helicase
MTLLTKRVQREHGAWLAEVTLVIPDECHHVLRDNTWGRGLALTPKARVLGPTAWPGRTDGKGIGRHAHGVFDVIIPGPSMPELIRMGYLTPFRVFCPPGDFNRASLDVGAGGEFTEKSVQAAVSKSTLTGDFVKHYQRIVPGKTAFVFTTDVKNAGIASDNFNAAGIRAAVLDGKTDVGLRIETMAAFERREYKVIANVALFGEGTDIPNLDASIMGDPTQSYCKFLQEAGRAARLSIDPAIAAHWETYTDEQRRAFIAASDKPYGYLIDHVGNVKQHGLPGARTDYSLDDRERGGKNKPADVMPTRMCANCTAEYEAVHRACPYCETVQVPGARSGPEFVDGDLFELDLSALQGLQKLVAHANDAPAVPYGATAGMAQHSSNKHYEKLRERAALFELRDVWAGWRQQQGDTSSMAMRRFYHTFGVDVLTAQTLNRADSEVLKEKIRTVLTKSSVRSSVPLVHNEEL